MTIRKGTMDIAIDSRSLLPWSLACISSAGPDYWWQPPSWPTCRT